MVKTNWVTDLDAQQISRLNEHILVADRIQKVGRNACQGNGLLLNKLLKLSGDGGATTFPPSLSLEGSALADQSTSLLAQNNRDSRSVASPVTPISFLLKDP